MLEEYFKSLLAEKYPQSLYEPIDYILQQGGKRLRPNLVGMSAAMFGSDNQSVTNVAAAFEMLHNFTLIHDDIMDEAPIRRGKPTVYRKWNSNVAILAGDALASMSVQEMMKVNASAETVLSLVKLLGTTCIEVCEGQQYDLDFEQIGTVSLDEYINMIRLKTAVMIAGCLKAGAVFAGASDADCQSVYECGINLGLAFQLRDDLLDIYADQAQFGKIIGGDIRENKKTYLFLRALKEASPEQKSELARCFSSTEMDFEEKFNSVTSIYNDLSIRRKTEQTIEDYVSISLHYLDLISVPETNKQELKNWICKLSYREK